jgi:hypothetical protein
MRPSSPTPCQTLGPEATVRRPPSPPRAVADQSFGTAPERSRSRAAQAPGTLRPPAGPQPRTRLPRADEPASSPPPPSRRADEPAPRGLRWSPPLRGHSTGRHAPQGQRPHVRPATAPPATPAAHAAAPVRPPPPGAQPLSGSVPSPAPPRLRRRRPGAPRPPRVGQALPSLAPPRSGHRPPVPSPPPPPLGRQAGQARRQVKAATTPHTRAHPHARQGRMGSGGSPATTSWAARWPSRFPNPERGAGQRFVDEAATPAAGTRIIVIIYEAVEAAGKADMGLEYLSGCRDQAKWTARRCAGRAVE